jgi:hypothetical protein
MGVIVANEDRGKPTELQEGAMLWDALKLKGYAILASDGPLGSVCDLLFDDEAWKLRWLVGNTRYWQPSHEVLLPASSLKGVDLGRRQLSVDLRMDQIRACPGVDLDPPVSRQTDVAGGDHGGQDLRSKDLACAVLRPARRADPHLRSVEAVVGHRVHAVDGVVGHVDDLLIDDADWSIRYVKIDTCGWLPWEIMLIPPRSVRGIDWRARLIRVAIDRRLIEGKKTQFPYCGIGWTRT